MPARQAPRSNGRTAPGSSPCRSMTARSSKPAGSPPSPMWCASGRLGPSASASVSRPRSRASPSSTSSPTPSTRCRSAPRAPPAKVPRHASPSAPTRPEGAGTSFPFRATDGPRETWKPESSSAAGSSHRGVRRDPQHAGVDRLVVVRAEGLKPPDAKPGGVPGRRLAVLLDAENVSPAFAPRILAEAMKHGTVEIRRAFGAVAHSGWNGALVRHAFHTLARTPNAGGRTAADIELAIAAMDLLHDDRIDGYCLVSSDHADRRPICAPKNTRGQPQLCGERWRRADAVAGSRLAP